MTRRWRGWVGAGCAVTGICGASAQGQGRVRARPVCDGQVISRIDIQTYPPFEPGGSSLTARAARIATELHATTRPTLIRRYLAFQLGDKCDEFRRSESERILRAQPFIADAQVVAAPDGAGGVAISVVTVDETSLVLDGAAAAKAPMVRAFRMGDQNVGGAGIAATTAWQHGTLNRDIFRGRIVDYQFLGRPYQFSLDGARNEIGGNWNLLASQPFLTDLQRTSWRVSAGQGTGFMYFDRVNAPNVALQFTRAYWDVGGVVALGPAQRRRFLIGGTVSRERERTGRMPVYVSNAGVVTDTTSALIGRYGEHRSTRANLLLGYRDVHFFPVHAFDAVEGAQDVRTGIQISTLVGRGFRVMQKDDRDDFVSTDVYAGHGTPQSFTGVEIMSERRQDLEAHRWDGALASGRAAWYMHPAPKYTSLLDVEYSGGWRQRVPFQLSLADREGGLRGFSDSELGGGERLVTRLEERYRLGHFKQFAALAGGVFVDAGKLWAGDAPFGTTTGVKASIGVSLLAAIPPRSRRTWRVDIARALNATTGKSRVEVRFSNHDFTRWFWREPGDVQSSRERSIPNSVYNWP